MTINNKIRNMVLATGLAATLAGATTLTGCSKTEENNQPKNYSNETTFVATAEKVRIEPHYGIDTMFMDGIAVTKFAQGNGLNIPYIKELKIYNKGSPEYKALRPLLTVEQIGRQ